MTPPQEPRTGGVPLQMRTDGLWQIDTKYPTHLAFPLAEAEALEAAVRRLTRERDEALAERDETYLAGVQQAEALIDPNDPAVAERILAIDGGGLFEQWEVDLILAALRGAK